MLLLLHCWNRKLLKCSPIIHGKKVRKWLFYDVALWYSSVSPHTQHSFVNTSWVMSYLCCIWRIFFYNKSLFLIGIQFVYLYSTSEMEWVEREKNVWCVSTWLFLWNLMRLIREQIEPDSFCSIFIRVFIFVSYSVKNADKKPLPWRSSVEYFMVWWSIWYLNS